MNPKGKSRATDEQWVKLKAQFYDKDYLVGTIDFSRKGMKDVVGGEKLSYDDYLDAQYAAQDKIRTWLLICFFEGMDYEFEGTIEAIHGENLCFARLAISGTYMDGTGFEGKEDHVWMSRSGFEDLKVGDCVSFCAEVYRYIKTGNGRMLDYGLRKPYLLKKIESYKQPTDDALHEQFINQLICEVCMLREQCFNICIANEDWLKAMRKMLRNES